MLFRLDEAMATPAAIGTYSRLVPPDVAITARSRGSSRDVLIIIVSADVKFLSISKCPSGALYRNERYQNTRVVCIHGECDNPAGKLHILRNGHTYVHGGT